MRDHIILFIDIIIDLKKLFQDFCLCFNLAQNVNLY